MASGINELFQIGKVAEQTRTVMARRMDLPTLDDRARETLDAALIHLSDVREGFMLTVRTAGSGASTRELAELVRYTLSTLDSLFKALDFDIIEDETVHLPEWQLLAFAHSYLTLGLMPRLPREWVTYPQARTYADIPVPRTPGEILERIEELEKVVMRMLLDRQQLRGDALRRTYGFFEASAWLVRNQARLLRPND